MTYTHFFALGSLSIIVEGGMKGSDKSSGIISQGDIQLSMDYSTGAQLYYTAC